jgi:hypothetical protein
LKPTAFRAFHKEIEEAGIGRRIFTGDEIFSRIKAFEFEGLSSMQMVLLPDEGGKDDLTFAGKCGGHIM